MNFIISFKFLLLLNFLYHCIKTTEIIVDNNHNNNNTSNNVSNKSNYKISNGLNDDNNILTNKISSIHYNINNNNNNNNGIDILEAVNVTTTILNNNNNNNKSINKIQLIEKNTNCTKINNNLTKIKNKIEIKSLTEIPHKFQIINNNYDDIELNNENQYDIDKTSRKFKTKTKNKNLSKKPTIVDIALQSAAKQGLEAMNELYNKLYPAILYRKQYLHPNHPAALLSKFSEQYSNTDYNEKAAFATLEATKSFQKSYKRQTEELGRQAPTNKISFRRTALEGLCPPREQPICLPAAQRYRTHDGTCNNPRRSRWGSAQMPFNRFLPPDYGDGVDSIRNSVDGGTLSSARFVSLLVHGARDGDAPVTLMLAQWGQLVDHDLTSTAQPRSINGSVPRCCGPNDFHPSCFPIKVPLDDPWLAPLKVRCLEFLRSAPAQRRDCVLSWREQSNQATSFVDASPIYSSNARTSDNARVFRNGLLFFGRGNPLEDVCHRGALNNQCIRPGDPRSGEQPGLLALHHVWVTEHNRIALELSDLNSHWSDEKVYQETRRIVGALFQHITYREFLPLVLGREVCRLFDLDLLNSGYYSGYDPHINPTVANSFAAAAFRFGHSLVQSSYLRCDFDHNFIDNNVTLHEEFSRGDIGSSGSLHRLLRGMAAQRALKRDEFITPELTNHLFQSGSFPFGLDLAAINIQRGRDHGVPPYTQWREPCGLSPVNNWEELIKIVGPESTNRIRHAYSSVHDIDLFVGGIAERPVVGGLVGPTFACIIAQQFSNLRKGDRFWYENPRFESSFTPAQLQSIRHVSLSQILCRVLGGGTLQPHIFIPNEADGNERIKCGKGSLAPIDLSPWQEQDPFNTRFPNLPENKQNTDEQITVMQNSTNEIILDKNDVNDPINKIDFIPNGSIGINRPDSKVHDKLDFVSRFKPQINKPLPVDNKIDTNLRKTSTVPTKRITTKRTIIINNIPIELGRTANKNLSTEKTTEILNITLTKNKTKTLEDTKNSSIISNNPLTTIKNVNLNTMTLTITTNAPPKIVRTAKLSRNLLKLVSKNNTSVQKNFTIITKHNFFKITTDNPEVKFRAKPTELRNYYGIDNNAYRPSQNIVTKPTQNTLNDDTSNSNPQYEIEINIRQTNKGNKQNYLNRPSLALDYSNKEFSNQYQTIPPRRSDTNFYPSTISPFSHNRPIHIETEPIYDIPNNLPSGPLTKPPKIIYLNDNDDYYRPTTTTRPNFLQSLFGTFSSVSTQFDRTSGQTDSGFYVDSTKQDGGLVNRIAQVPDNNFGTSFTVNIKPAPKPTSSFGNGYPLDMTIKRPQNDHHQYGLLKPHTPQVTNTGPFINTEYYDNRGTYKTTSTRRPFYNSPNTYNYPLEELRNFYPEHKILETILDTNHTQNDITKLDTNLAYTKLNEKETTNLTTTQFPTDTDYYDYDDDNESIDKKFDKDGYLRPEHMSLDFLQPTNKQVNIQLNNTASLVVDDDFVMPVLMKQKDKINNMTNLYANQTLPRRNLKDDILAEEEKPIVLLNINKIKTKATVKIPFPTHPTVPINVLTKPERPDKWIIYNPALPEKPPLPDIPELIMENSFTTQEFPKPIAQSKLNMANILLKATQN